ncbi:MAG: protein translocase subunit SecD [Bdellovibrionaceae bacterium]|nr:protein translocase subunit SecD [Pseudobdellovibrionaceae bacterium]MDW8190626.1 protein translocase subunit SecD [Pseudobdellovibrionaceae bacterium]
MEKANYRWKLVLVFVVLLGSLLYFIPNVFHVSWWPVQQKLNYGLDIQGGLHLVMGIDMKEVFRSLMAREAKSVRSSLAEEGIVVSDLQVQDEERGEIVISLKDVEPGKRKDTKQRIERFMTDHLDTRYLKVSEDDERLVYRMLDAFVLDYRQKVLSQSLETIRNRIDEFGVAEPSILAQGDDRILIQLPGISDVETAKQLISSAARLEFMLVEDKPIDELQAMIREAEEKGGYQLGKLKYSDYIKRLNSDLKDKLPPNTIIYFEKAGQATQLEAGRVPYLLRTDTGVDGGLLEDARISFDQFSNPEVALQFNPTGAVKFREVTGKNVGRRLAVVLDKVVKSAPTIKVEISDGRASITLGGARDRQAMMEEAKMLVTTLRAGALPATLEQLEERRIGPTLGADHLKRAELGAFLGALGVLLIMILRYRSFGVLSCIALVYNVILILALLTSFKATLTLPGIAGIALTVGVAVDANVLIFERIREELKRGLGFAYAVREGYSKAWSAIMDANIVVAATSIILLYFGTGPVRGFAVTLLTGIVTTLFSQVFLTHAVLQWLLEGRKVKQLAI